MIKVDDNDAEGAENSDPENGGASTTGMIPKQIWCSLSHSDETN